MSGVSLLFAGGGTGGHLFPALAIDEHCRTLDPHVPTHYLCSDRPIDARVLRAADAEWHASPARPLHATPTGVLRFAKSWGPAVRDARRTIRALRHDGRDVRVIASGGFVAAPIVQAARVERAAVTMLNLDAVPGKANRWIARHAQTIFTAAPLERPGWTRIPPIRRASPDDELSPADARAVFGLDPETPTLLVTGGSQGARSVNLLVLAMLQRNGLGNGLGGWQAIHQCGDGPVADELRESFARAGVRATVEPFFDRIAAAWRAADLALSRSGAGSVADAWAFAVPAVFMPYPYHRDEHQKLNAEPLRAAGSALVIADRIDPTPNLEHAGRTLDELLADEPRRASMRDAARALGPADGARRVATHALAH